jgi:hypothetical protein
MGSTPDGWTWRNLECLEAKRTASVRAHGVLNHSRCSDYVMSDEKLPAWSSEAQDSNSRGVNVGKRVWTEVKHFSESSQGSFSLSAFSPSLPLCKPQQLSKMAADTGGPWHPLRTILHTYVATDAQAVEYLQHTMATLSRDALLASSHLPKWTARLSSLLQSKEPAARWTGLCLALKTAQLSKVILMECAQAWVTLSLNLLSVGVFSSA